MNKIGVIKEIDTLGRICIPKDIRKLYGFENEVAIMTTEDGILIQNPKYKLVKIEKNTNET